MSKRTVSALIFTAILVMELAIFMIQPSITKEEVTHIPKTNNTLFGGARTERNVVIDAEAENARNTKFGILISATLLIGAVVTFSIPVKSESKPGIIS